MDQGPIARARRHTYIDFQWNQNACVTPGWAGRGRPSALNRANFTIVAVSAAAIPGGRRRKWRPTC
jgi:hypothetical protein